MERPPTLRPAEGADLDALTAVFLRSRAEAMPWLPRIRSDASTRWWIDHAVLAELEVWVAEREDVLLGFAALRPGRLEHLHVAPEAQGTGVGRALLGRAVERGGAGMVVRVLRRNERAIAFFTGRGFVWEEEGDGSDNEDGRPDVLLRGPGPDASW